MSRGGPILVSAGAFRIFAALCAVLVLKNLGLAALTAAHRLPAKAWANVEDAKLFGGEVRLDDRVERVRRAHANALENDPYFVIAGLLYLLVGAPEFGIQAYGYTYVIARFVHPVVYVLGWQPLRTIAYLVGFLATAGMSVQVLMKAFSG